MIVDGSYSEQNLMGIAYFNTSNAFFGPAYDEASSGPGSISRYRVEAISFSPFTPINVTGNHLNQPSLESVLIEDKNSLARSISSSAT